MQCSIGLFIELCLWNKHLFLRGRQSWKIIVEVRLPVFPVKTQEFRSSLANKYVSNVTATVWRAYSITLIGSLV